MDRGNDFVLYYVVIAYSNIDSLVVRPIVCHTKGLEFKSHEMHQWFFGVDGWWSLLILRKVVCYQNYNQCYIDSDSIGKQ